MTSERCVSCTSLECFGPVQWSMLMKNEQKLHRRASAMLMAFETLANKLKHENILVDDNSEMWDLSTRLLFHGIPTSNLRAELWPRFIKTDEWKQKFSGQMFSKLKDPQNLPDRVRHSILLDTRRTFPTHTGFKSDDRINDLRDVLTAYASFDSRVGYTQGMAFVAGMLLLQRMPTEEVFWCLVALSFNEKYKMRGIWGPEADPESWSYVRAKLWDTLELSVPAFVELMDRDDEAADMIMLPFLPSLFCNRFSFNQACRVFDAFVLVGWDVVLSIISVLIARSWAAIPSPEENSNMTAAVLLPLIYRDCADHGDAVTVSAWWGLLPQVTSGTESVSIGPPTEALQLSEPI
eukprot:TRINITY_DN3700_c0_g1_i1.p1 TRINITY_DN3700_c0_g1~~TRINITY_DN3700_c0_g1_i1.p1  ORF type:complete len:350 (+),score=24.09 TRINITY_DN3700_c0_g1_i1:43-1092(+)